MKVMINMMWPSDLDIMLTYWCCIAYMVRVKFPSREENKNQKFKDLILTLLGFIFRFIYSKKRGGAVNEIND